ncbi:MAG TPA: porphobilinogen synthase [Fibrobacteria bacterium]|nr:porphobilinogen synthase [Fibrobacteria bacterium]
MLDLPRRPRRNRRNAAIRSMVRETSLSPANLIMPCFVREGQGLSEPVASMPGCHRHSLDRLVEAAREWAALGIPAIALFPVTPPQAKTGDAKAALDPDGLVPRALKSVKDALPELQLITDLALDPFTDHGHDGLMSVDGRILNDETVEVLCGMAALHARCGADIVAPSDMMDGRVGEIRSSLDSEGFENTGIMAYTAKYASGFYGPFRDALDSAPRSGDKKTYQMDPANRREALLEADLDEAEGADILMVKPGLPYLDVLRELRDRTTLPLAAYHVSGEFAMLKAAAANGWLDYDRCLMEAMICFRRAGADMVLTYGAADAARLMG